MSQEEHLRVYQNRSELVNADGGATVFEEGPNDSGTRERYGIIDNALKEGFLENQINICKLAIEPLNEIPLPSHLAIDSLVSSVTSEVGRALIGLTVMQMVIKYLSPEQNIRLHKGGASNLRNFSWKQGISMRSLDKRYITPVLRRHNLLKLNADGFMMTRSLAENYPYSKLYKANLRGARLDWLQIVEHLESKTLDPISGLRYILSRLLNSAENFLRISDETCVKVQDFLQTTPVNMQSALGLMQAHVNNSDYAARLMEISMHSLMQGLIELNFFPGEELRPLSQMRSANKKHGNIGDIELVQDDDVVEAWDAKYGKAYLRDELEELADKLSTHMYVKIAGFVTSGEPEKIDELHKRIKEIETENNLLVSIITFDKWVQNFYKRAASSGIHGNKLSKYWITAYTETLAQKRREIAPVDEPCEQWLESLSELIKL